MTKLYLPLGEAGIPPNASCDEYGNSTDEIGCLGIVCTDCIYSSRHIGSDIEVTNLIPYLNGDPIPDKALSLWTEVWKDE
jgi:hypothetical protein